MKAALTISALIALISITLSWTGSGEKPTPLTFTIPPGWPKPVYDFAKNPLTRQGFELGRRLFYDTLLSRDGTISCASCHQQFGGFATYEHSLSHGVDNTLTTRNAPALQNLAWQSNFMWDGGIPHLDLQPLAPITDSNEMGEELSRVIARLRKDPQYPKLFRAAFGEVTINTNRMNRALSQFMLMLVSANSKYDKVMRGEASFIVPEKAGYEIFKQKCSTCHKEPLFTDLTYRNAGLPVDNTLNDYGRMKITGDPKDSLKFKVPSLRNVAITFPYGHDGRFGTLLSVFEHYRAGMVLSPGTDSVLQHRIRLSNYEIGQLTAFLYTLTDSAFLKDPRFAPEGYVITPNFIHRH